MTDTIVLDSLAILALLNDEPGANKVEAVLDHAVVGAANLAEVAAKLGEKGLGKEEVEEVLAVIHDVRPMTKEQALTAGALRMPTRSMGLSLGDRACIALAMAPRSASLISSGAASKAVSVARSTRSPSTRFSWSLRAARSSSPWSMASSNMRSTVSSSSP